MVFSDRKDDIDTEELAASARAIGKRLTSLRKAGVGRNAGASFTRCVADAIELMAAAEMVLKDPCLPVPSIQRVAGSSARSLNDPKKVAEEMAASIVGHPDDPRNSEVPDSQLAPSIVLRGRCDSLPVSQLLEMLAALRKTGILWIKSATESFTIQFEDGFVVHAASNNTPRDQRLGAILVREGMIDQQRLDEFLARHTRWDGRIGTALERSDLVPRERLAQALEMQTRQLFQRLTEASNATFTFSKQPAGNNDNRIRVSLLDLLLERVPDGDAPGPGDLSDPGP